jgi:chemotaxis regulatin CheY-phosphate phosphatase CheZ
MKPAGQISETQYVEIEDQLQKTEAGRAFLRERDKRSRVITFDEFESRVQKMEQWLSNVGKGPAAGRATQQIVTMRASLRETIAAIVEARRQIAALKPKSGVKADRIVDAAQELEDIVQQTEDATQEILGAAESILGNEMASEGARAAVHAKATEIMMACGFQDLTGQRIRRVTETLNYVETRINAMLNSLEEGMSNAGPPIPAPGAKDNLLNGPGAEGAVDQTAVDTMLGEKDGEGTRSTQAEIDNLMTR